jgi:hypothetical protein
MTKKPDEYTKAAVVLGVRSGAKSRADACKKYTLSVAEFALWELAYDHEGIPVYETETFRPIAVQRATDKHWASGVMRRIPPVRAAASVLSRGVMAIRGAGPGPFQWRLMPR